MLVFSGSKQLAAAEVDPETFRGDSWAFISQYLAPDQKTKIISGRQHSE